GVVAVPGCNNWVGTDLSWADGRKVIILFDADFTSNRDVYDAAAGLKEALEVEGANEVVFAHLAGARSKDGRDDVRGRRPEDRRTLYIERIAGMASDRLGRRPTRSVRASAYFDERGLLARTSALAVLGGQPAALAAGSLIALYRNGVYRIDLGDEPLIEQVKDLLGEDYRPTHRKTIEEFLVGELASRNLRVGGRSTEPLLNTASCMIDLRTGEVLDHDPKYLSTLQIPVPWVPDAACPTYEAWLADVIPDQAEALEELASTMLDPSRTPLKQAFLFGPTHSGKSTFLRIMEAIAGEANRSAVDLHQLVDDHFASAELYQKILNIGSDMSAAHISDVSLFKKLTGEDPVQANRKYGKMFTFTNRALFAFSANEIPTVGETSRAYVQRMAAFRFDKSFAGNERPEIEERMLREELPGILRRWVSAWRRFNDRGLYLPVPEEVQSEFETSSDRVARWVALRCDVDPEVIGKMVGPEKGDTVSSLYSSFKIWARDDGPANVMSRQKFSERLRHMDGVGDVRLIHRNKNLGLNITTRTGEDRELIRVRSVPVTDADAPNVGVGGVGPQGKYHMPTTQNVNDQEMHARPPTEKQDQSEDNQVHVVLPPGTHTTHTEQTGPSRADHDVTATEGIKSDERRLDDRPGVRGGPSPQPDPPVSGSGRQGSNEAAPLHRPEAGREDRRSDGTRATRKDRDGQSVPGEDVPEGDFEAGVRGSSSVTSSKTPTLPTPPRSEYCPDPFADHTPPPYGVPVGIDIESWDAEDLFHHDVKVLGPYVRLVGAGPAGDVATGRAEVLERIKGDNPLVGVNLALFDLPALDVHAG